MAYTREQLIASATANLGEIHAQMSNLRKQVRDVVDTMNEIGEIMEHWNDPVEEPEEDQPKLSDHW